MGAKIPFCDKSREKREAKTNLAICLNHYSLRLTQNKQSKTTWETFTVTMEAPKEHTTKNVPGKSGIYFGAPLPFTHRLIGALIARAARNSSRFCQFSRKLAKRIEIFVFR